MLKKLGVIIAQLALFGSLSFQAAANPQAGTNPGSGAVDSKDDFDSMYGGEDDELELIRFSDDYVHLKIAEDMDVSCKKGLCTIFAVSTSGSTFTTSFNLGWSDGVAGGSINNGAYGYGGGNNGYYGPGNGGIGGGAYGSSSGPGSTFIGLNLIYTKYDCTQKVNVPASLYRSMNTFLYRLMDENGKPRRSFNPADETMIMFYTSIMKKANGCNNNNRIY